MPGQTPHNLIQAEPAWRGWVAASVVGWMICGNMAAALVADDSVPRRAPVRQSNPKQPPAAATTRSSQAQRASIRTAEQVQPVPARGRSVPNVKPVLNVSSADVTPAELDQAWWLKPMLEPMRDDAEPDE